MARPKRKVNPILPVAAPAEATKKLYQAGGYVRLSVEDSGKGEAAVQLDLFQSAAPQRRERVERLERTMDAIRSKYGRGSVTVAALAPRDGPEDSPEAERSLPF